MKKISLKLFLLLGLLTTLPACGKAHNSTGDSTSVINRPASQGINYEKNGEEDSYIVLSMGTCTEEDVVIAAVYNGLPVVGITGLAFQSQIALKSIYLPNSITFIGEKAFYGSGLDSLYIPQSVTAIGAAIVVGCYGMVIYCQAASQPSGWSDKWNEANSQLYWGVNETNSTTQNHLTYVVKDHKATLAKAQRDVPSSMDIPSSISLNNQTYEVNRIGALAFYGRSITSVSIPNSVQVIEQGAFSNCRSLSSASLPNSVTTLESFVFSNCTALININLPSSLTSMGGYNFYECSALTSITWPSNVTSIGDCTFFQCTSLAEITIPNTVTSLGLSAFYGCTSLASINLPSSLTSLNEYVFSHCTGLSTIVIPRSVLTMGQSVFSSDMRIDIFCEATQKPTDWHYYWYFNNNGTIHVYWSGNWSYVNGQPTPN